MYHNMKIFCLGTEENNCFRENFCSKFDWNMLYGFLCLLDLLKSKNRPRLISLYKIYIWGKMPWAIQPIGAGYFMRSCQPLQIFFLQSSHNRVNLLSYESKLTEKREQYDWRDEKNLDGCVWYVVMSNLWSTHFKWESQKKQHNNFDSALTSRLLSSSFNINIVGENPPFNAYSSNLFSYCYIWYAFMPTVHRTRPKIFRPSSRTALVYQPACSRTIADQLLYDWIAEKNLDGKLHSDALH